jgi:bacterioferritin-associated ferredoxin
MASVALDFENAIHYPLRQRFWMYVCICRAVTDREVKSAIDLGARTVQAVTQACCAGDDCGACHEMIEDMIAERSERVEAPGGVDRRPSVRLPVVSERAA